MQKHLLIITLVFLPFLPGQFEVYGDSSTSQSNFITPKLKKDLVRGLDYLAKQQSIHDGSFSKKYKLATTALAGMALLAYPNSGYKRGRYGKHIARALDYILSLVRKEDRSLKYLTGGMIWIHDGENQGRMHAHCYATLFLTQVYGTLRSPKKEKVVWAVLKGAIQLLLLSQTSGVHKVNGQTVRWGGWGYYYRGEPKADEDEASITVCVLQALRGARNCGMLIPNETVERAINYLKRCMKKDGSFRYSIARNIQRSSYELTAAAVSTFNAAGVYNRKAKGKEKLLKRSHELDMGLNYMKESIRKETAIGNTPDAACGQWYYYGNFYAAQAMYQAGELQWKDWFPKVRDSILQKQNSGGYWPNRRFGKEYATAMACLILQVPFQTLPIYQK